MEARRGLLWGEREVSEQGNMGFKCGDAQMMEITKAQMELLEGRVPEKSK